MEQIEIEDIAHVRFSAPDLGVMRGFLEDFGLRCAEQTTGDYMRGDETAIRSRMSQNSGLRASWDWVCVRPRSNR